MLFDFDPNRTGIREVSTKPINWRSRAGLS